MSNMRKKVCIICCLDRFANAVRTNKIKEFLEKNGYIVELINRYPRNAQSKSSIKVRKIRKSLIPKILRNYFFILDMKRRTRLLLDEISKRNPDILICESEMDSYVMTKPMNCLKIFDCSTPWVDELLYSGDLSSFGYKILRRMELEIYRKSSYVSFHWDSYTNFIKRYIYNGDNLFILNWGCSKRKVRAKYNKIPKVVYLGKLDGYWINIELLSRLSKIYPIDIYGAPEPALDLGINFKGYVPITKTDILAEYQFGLITLSKDKLRSHGFSAKHLEYMSYGLPVLLPEWRDDPKLKEYSILYNEKNFLEKIKEYSSKDKWQELSEKSLKQSKEWDWEETLKPLVDVIEKHFN